MQKQICFIYTETNGLHQTNEDVSKKILYNFARMVTLNYEIGYVQGKEYIIEKKVRIVVKPRCMHIPDETIQYHGITMEYAEANGTDPAEIIKTFKEDIKNVQVIVSHNVDFHLKTIIAEAVRYNILIDLSNHIVIDTISFYHSYGYMKLKDLATKLKIKDIPDETDKNTELIRNVFLKLYIKYEKSVKET